MEEEKEDEDEDEEEEEEEEERWGGGERGNKEGADKVGTHSWQFVKCMCVKFVYKNYHYHVLP